MSATHRTNVCIVTSAGGHLTEARILRPAYQDCDYFYVLNDRAILPDDMKGRTYFITHSERDWKFLVNLAQAWAILRRERPHVILSTGAGAIVAFAIVGKLLRVKTVFVETYTRVTRPSLTGRLMYHLADRFYYQWPALQRYFPRATFGGPLV